MPIETFFPGRGGGADRPWAESALVLGAHLEVLRGRRRQSEVVEATGKRVSTSYYSRLERGEVRIDKPHVLDIILNALGVAPGEYRDHLLDLAVAASKEGWASRFRSGHREVVTDSILRLTSLEESTTEQFVLDREAVSGQLQTEAYARLVTRFTLPASLRDEGLQEVIVGLRDERGTHLGRRLILNQTRARFFLDEAVLWRDFGQPEALADQLQFLLDLVNARDLPIGIRVMSRRNPLAVPITTLARLGFRRSLAELPVPDVIYNETGRNASFHRGPLHGAEVADPDYVDLDDLIDNVLMRAPGYRESRQLIESALLEAKFRMR
ncbi:Scr1 family TA system antitoxin-like transcriptional regulator [Kitasatospora sp. NPDC088783]|uniref:Scr1 family TA system antitoxin-like transcriptional regulator n=1 Tax=Kitasatospora sp. NPDC088783 TaxID=3364077 RepID=UPI0038043207